MDALAATFMTMAVPLSVESDEGSYPGLDEGSYPGPSPMGSAFPDDDMYAPVWRSVQAMPAAAPEALLFGSASPMQSVQSGYTTVTHSPLSHAHGTVDFNHALTHHLPCADGQQVGLPSRSRLRPPAPPSPPRRLPARARLVRR